MTKDESPLCTSCSAHREERQKLIAGPAVFICDECIAAAYALVMLGGRSVATSNPRETQFRNVAGKCQFCSQSTPAVQVLEHRGLTICNECLDICIDIIEEDRKVKGRVSNSHDASDATSLTSESPPCFAGEPAISEVFGTELCSFCFASKRSVNKLIKGLAVFICDECVGEAHATISGRRDSSVKKFRKALPGRKVCQFCSEFRVDIQMLESARGTAICEDCLELCVDIINLDSGKLESAEDPRAQSDWDSLPHNNQTAEYRQYFPGMLCPPIVRNFLKLARACRLCDTIDPPARLVLSHAQVSVCATCFFSFFSRWSASVTSLEELMRLDECNTKGIENFLFHCYSCGEGTDNSYDGLPICDRCIFRAMLCSPGSPTPCGLGLVPWPLFWEVGVEEHTKLSSKGMHYYMAGRDEIGKRRYGISAEYSAKARNHLIRSGHFYRLANVIHNLAITSYDLGRNDWLYYHRLGLVLSIVVRNYAIVAKRLGCYLRSGIEYYLQEIEEIKQLATPENHASSEVAEQEFGGLFSLYEKCVSLIRTSRIECAQVFVAYKWPRGFDHYCELCIDVMQTLFENFELGDLAFGEHPALVQYEAFFRDTSRLAFELERDALSFLALGKYLEDPLLEVQLKAFLGDVRLARGRYRAAIDAYEEAASDLALTDTSRRNRLSSGRIMRAASRIKEEISRLEDLEGRLHLIEGSLSKVEKGVAFEKACADLFRAAGFSVTRDIKIETERGSFQVDISFALDSNLIIPNLFNTEVLVECKCWKKAVSRDVVIKMAFLKENARHSNLLLLHAGGITKSARKLASQRGIGVLDVRQLIPLTMRALRRRLRDIAVSLTEEILAQYLKIRRCVEGATIGELRCDDRGIDGGTSDPIQETVFKDLVDKDSRYREKLAAIKDRYGAESEIEYKIYLALEQP